MKKILLVALIVVVVGFGYGCKGEKEKDIAVSSQPSQTSQDSQPSQTSQNSQIGQASSGEKGADKSKSPAPGFKVRTVAVKSVDLPLSIIAVGTLEPNEEVMVSAEVSAKLTGLFVDEGDEVARDQALVVLDEEKFVLERDRAGAELDQRGAELAFAEKDLVRKSGLLREGTVSQEDYDSALSRRDALTSALAAAKAELLLKARELADSRIRAPFSGTISKRYVSVGSYVQEGDRLFRLIDMGSLKVFATIPERFLGRLRPGQEVTLTVGTTGEDKIYSGLIYFISPEVDPKNRSFEIKARIKNQKKELRPGLFAEVTIVTGIKKGLFLVPEGGVLTRNDETIVFVEAGGKVEMRSVDLLERRGAMAVISSGLKTGELVVIEGAYDLDDGASVRVIVGERKTGTQN